MAIKFKGKDQPTPAPAATEAPAEKIAREPAAAKAEVPGSTDLFNDAAKAPGKRKRK
jgi:hypothetical protein